MTTAYTTPVKPEALNLPRTLMVQVTAVRVDGDDLTREELEALAAAFPPPAKHRAEVGRAIARATENEAATAPRKLTKAHTKAPAGKPVSKSSKAPARPVEAAMTPTQRAAKRA